jgi:hypothetical protein
MGVAVKAAYEKAVVAVNKVKEWAEAHSASRTRPRATNTTILLGEP